MGTVYLTVEISTTVWSYKVAVACCKSCPRANEGDSSDYMQFQPKVDHAFCAHKHIDLKHFFDTAGKIKAEFSAYVLDGEVW